MNPSEKEKCDARWVDAKNCVMADDESLSRAVSGQRNRPPEPQPVWHVTTGHTFPPRFLNCGQCASRYAVSASTWRRLVDSGRAPQPRHFGRLVRWAIADLDSWDAGGNRPSRSARAGK